MIDASRRAPRADKGNTMPDNTRTAGAQRADFYSDDELRKRGWTSEKIGQLLGNPDIRGVNHQHGTGAIVGFYLKERVHRAEQPGAVSEGAPVAMKAPPPGVYTFDQAELAGLLHKAIDAFMDYQYRHGYEEPRAREEAIRNIIRILEDG